MADTELHPELRRIARVIPRAVAVGPRTLGLLRAATGITGWRLARGAQVCPPAHAEKLRRCGVVCQMQVVPGAFHGFDQLAPRTGGSRSFFTSQCASLSAASTPKG